MLCQTLCFLWHKVGVFLAQKCGHFSVRFSNLNIENFDRINRRLQGIFEQQHQQCYYHACLHSKNNIIIRIGLRIARFYNMVNE